MKPVSVTNPDPALTNDQLRAEPVEVVVVEMPPSGGGLTDDELRAEPVHVIVDTMPAGGSGLTDSELRASPVAVSGTFYPATQPVSGTFWPATQPVSVADPVAVTGQFWQTTQPVSIASAVAVTGTFWQATQPISGTVAVSNFPATQPVSGTVAVSNFPATQPVSGTVSVGNFPATQPVSAASLPLPAGAATEATLAAMSAKLPGTRNSLALGCIGTAGVVAETILSCIATTDLVAAGAANTYTVPVGKRLRIQALVAVWRNPTAAAGGVTVRLRAVPSGTATATSPLLATAAAWGAGATIGASSMGVVEFPDGLELPAGASLCLTQAAVTTAAGVEARLVGYLY